MTTTTTTTTTEPKEIARGDGFSFWLIGSAVYRSPIGSGIDTDGHPLGKRWECDHAQWLRFRSVFSWAVDC